VLPKWLEKHIPVEIGKMRATDFLISQERNELRKSKYVGEGKGWKTIACCPVCDSLDHVHELEKRGIPLVRCKNCDLRFHTKIPADPNDVYQASDYTVYTKDTEGEF